MKPEQLRLILASASPRRDELLNTAGLFHEVMVSGANEDVTQTNPRTLVELLSAKKAQEVCGRITSEDDFAVIGADTVVFIDGVILGKPAAPRTRNECSVCCPEERIMSVPG